MEIKIWGKSKNEEIEISLADHIKDVLTVFRFLSDKIKDENLKKLIEIVIKYHDAGKVLPYFQRKTLGNKTYQPFEVYTNIPHSLLSTLLVDQDALKEELKSIIPDELIDTYIKYILSAIAYHHWRENFYDIVEGHTNVFEQLKRLTSDNKKWNQIEENLKIVYSDIDAVALSLNKHWLDGLNNGIRFADYVIPPYLLYRMPKRIEMDATQLKDWILISGFTMLSDHYASFVEGNNDENFDKVEIDGILNYKGIKEKIAVELRAKLGSNYSESEIWQFKEAEKLKDTNTILLAPTGMGKTEFSYLWSNGEKFFYTLPLRTAVNQIFDRTEKIFGKENSGILHSDADVYVLGEDGESESMRIYDLSKQLSLPAIVSTGDQFFPYGLRPPAYEKIFAKFSYSRLIIDEIQAYDPKAAAIIVKFIEHIVQMGGKFLLMTATLPIFIKEEIEKRITVDGFNTLNLFKEDTELAKFSKHKVQLKVEPYKEDQLSYSKGLINEIIIKAKENNGSRILVVLNTIKQAQAVYDDLKKYADINIEIQLFHSRFTQNHRKTKEKALEKFIGNNDDSRKDKRAKILVATQVVEASLDLDADYLYTELAPWDSLIQRMGRVFRQYRNTSPPGMIENRYNQIEIPLNVFVIAYEGKNKKKKDVFESGQGYVYDEDLLKISLKLFEGTEGVTEGWLKKQVFDYKKIHNAELPLTESDKNNLIMALFEKIPLEGKYKKNFYGMLQILDAGFMSDRKSDAQKVFREINDVSVISDNEIENVINDIHSFDFEQKYCYSKFKKEILSKYLISVQISKVKEYIYESNLVYNQVKVRDIFKEEQKLVRLRKWLSGYYVVELEYSQDGGLKGVNELKNYDIL